MLSCAVPCRAPPTTRWHSAAAADHSHDNVCTCPTKHACVYPDVYPERSRSVRQSGPAPLTLLFSTGDLPGHQARPHLLPAQLHLPGRGVSCGPWRLQLAGPPVSCLHVAGTRRRRLLPACPLPHARTRSHVCPHCSPCCPRSCLPPAAPTATAAPRSSAPATCCARARPPTPASSRAGARVSGGGGGGGGCPARQSAVWQPGAICHLCGRGVVLRPPPLRSHLPPAPFPRCPLLPACMPPRSTCLVRHRCNCFILWLLLQTTPPTPTPSATPTTSLASTTTSSATAARWVPCAQGSAVQRLLQRSPQRLPCCAAAALATCVLATPAAAAAVAAATAAAAAAVHGSSMARPTTQPPASHRCCAAPAAPAAKTRRTAATAAWSTSPRTGARAPGTTTTAATSTTSASVRGQQGSRAFLTRAQCCARRCNRDVCLPWGLSCVCLPSACGPASPASRHRRRQRCPPFRPPPRRRLPAQVPQRPAVPGRRAGQPLQGVWRGRARKWGVGCFRPGRCQGVHPGADPAAPRQAGAARRAPCRARPPARPPACSSSCCVVLRPPDPPPVLDQVPDADHNSLCPIGDCACTGERSYCDGEPLGCGAVQRLWAVCGTATASLRHPGKQPCSATLRSLPCSPAVLVPRSLSGASNKHTDKPLLPTSPHPHPHPALPGGREFTCPGGAVCRGWAPCVYHKGAWGRPAAQGIGRRMRSTRPKGAPAAG